MIFSGLTGAHSCGLGCVTQMMFRSRLSLHISGHLVNLTLVLHVSFMRLCVGSTQNLKLQLRRTL